MSIGDDGDGARYPISHAWGSAPIHLITFRQDLDRRDPSSKRSPHSLPQEFLNRSDGHLWGFVSNGLRLRVLRDNAVLAPTAAGLTLVQPAPGPELLTRQHPRRSTP